jgi:hypothetical protein
MGGQSNNSTNLDDSGQYTQFQALQSNSMNQSLAELTTKVRQLEIGIMDVKALNDRKIQ